MGRRPKQTFLPRRHTDGHLAHEKWLSTASYSRNAHQNYNEVSPHIGQNGHHQKYLQTINAGEGVERRENLFHCWKCKLIQPLWRTLWRFLRKQKIALF